jgi:hypothetical protein
MALDGISSKMMIQRATELAKELHSEQKKVESSPFIRQMQAEAEIVNTQVRDIYKPDEAVIRRDEEKKKKKDGRKTDYGSDSKKPGLESPEVGRGNQKIDIRI